MPRYSDRSRRPPRPTLKPGAVPLRERHGTQHRLIVREDTIVFQGKPYKSLSEIAYRITGSKWSGPRFFGLTTNGQQQSDGVPNERFCALRRLGPDFSGKIS